MRRPIVLLAFVLLALLGAMAAMPLLEQPPMRVATPAASGEFDEAVAKARLAVILGNQRPHPADSPASDQVRARLVAQLQQLGLKPILRDQLACDELFKQRGVSCARVRNVIAILGPPTGKAVLLNAHYDSTPVGPGAADDGIGVATLLEVARNLKDEPLKRPVILLFNEGEELGLVGARAFLSDPLSRNVDSLINLEARGVRGPVNMFETSRPNPAAIAVFAAPVRNPVANSLSTDVYRLLPNYTDVNSFSERGWLTLNLAPMGNETRYHSTGDDVAALDPGTLRHMGDETLALAQTLVNDTPRTAGGDRIFMDLAGKALITLPQVIGAGLLVGLIIAFAVLAVRRRRAIRSIGIPIATGIGSAALSWMALTLIGAVRQGMFWRAEPQWSHLATYASVMVIGVFLLATLGRRADVRQLRSGFWFVYLVIGGMIGLIAPGGIILFIFPPLIALAGMIASRWWKPAEAVGSAAAILFLYISWGGMLGLLEELLNGGPMWIFAPLGSLLIVPVLIEAKPLLESAGVRTSAIIGALLVLLGWTVAAAAPAYSADRQQRFVIQHVTDAATGRSWWSVLNDRAPLPEAYRSFGTWKRGKLPFSESGRWIARTANDPTAKAPGVQLVSEVRNGNERTLTLHLAANGSERVALIAPTDSKIRSAGVQGFVRPIDQSEDGKYSIDCFGRSCDGVTLQLTTDQPKPIEFLVVGSSAPLPQSAGPLLAARPKFARPQYNRDESIVFATVNL